MKMCIRDRAVGVGESTKMDFHVYPILPKERILLCTDGLTDYVDDDVIRQMAQSEPLEHCCDDFISFAKENGGGDNITVVAAEY